MSRGQCPQAGAVGCWVAERKGGCYSDIDHVVPQRYKSLGWLVRHYINTPDNKERVCRFEHEQKTDTESIDLIPSENFMLSAVERAVESGYLHFNKRDKRRLEAYYERLEMDARMELVSANDTAQTLEDSVA